MNAWVLSGAVVGFILGISYCKGLGTHKNVFPICAFSGALVGIVFGWMMSMLLTGD